MAVLSDVEIREEYDAGSITVDPEPDWEVQLQPASIDLRLGKSFRVFRLATPDRKIIDLREGNPADFMTGIVLEEGERFLLDPGKFALASTIEAVSIPAHLLGQVDGRSSYARLGVSVHATAGFIDPGFQGQITLELFNAGAFSVALYTGLRVCQISFTRLGKPCRRPYGPGRNSKYHGQMGACPSQLHRDLDLDPPENSK
jgi:dCTP deaminase